MSEHPFSPSSSSSGEGARLWRAVQAEPRPAFGAPKLNLPTIPRANTNTPTLMMAEKAAEWIAQDACR